MGQQMVKIIKEICLEEEISYYGYSSDYIISLEKNGKIIYLYANKFPNNSASVEKICDDKAALSDVLEHFGIPAVKHYYFGEEGLTFDCFWKSNEKEMLSLLEKFGKIVLKELDGSGGKNVFYVDSKEGLLDAVKEILQQTDAICIAPFLELTEEYRVVMLNGELQYAFRKLRPKVIGDGVHSIAELCEKHAISLTENGELTKFSPIDYSKIPASGESVTAIWKHNLKQGAYPEFVTDIETLVPLSNLAKKCVNALSCGFVSVDIVRASGMLMVLEINSGIMVEHLSAYSEEGYCLAKETIRKAILNNFR